MYIWAIRYIQNLHDTYTGPSSPSHIHIFEPFSTQMLTESFRWPFFLLSGQHSLAAPPIHLILRLWWSWVFCKPPRKRNLSFHTLQISHILAPKLPSYSLRSWTSTVVLDPVPVCPNLLKIDLIIRAQEFACVCLTITTAISLVQENMKVSYEARRRCDRSQLCHVRIFSGSDFQLYLIGLI